VSALLRPVFGIGAVAKSINASRDEGIQLGSL